MPILNLSPAAPALLPSLLAGTPLSPVPAGEGQGDGFAAMLAGLTVPVVEGAGAGIPSTPVALPQPNGKVSPQVRQDPAVWLPGGTEGAVEAAPDAGLEAGGRGPLISGPDCEMPAYDMVLPQPEDAPTPAPSATPVVPLQAVPKFWTLRLSSALTPTRATPQIAATDEPAVTEAKIPETIAPTADIAPVLPALQPLHLAPQPAPAPLPIPVASPRSFDSKAEMPVVAERLARSAQPTASAPTASAPTASGQGLDLTPQEAPVTEAPAGFSVRPERPPQSGALIAPERPQPPDQLRSIPELMKQVVQAIEATPLSAEPGRAEAAPHLPSPPPAPVIAPTGQPQPATSPAPVQLAPVDLGRAEWVQAMVDRIAELPQAEGRREAQITLLPTALGKVEVTIVERGERIQVTLNADTGQARQMLSEAAPRLQEQAEARGLRFAEPQVGGGQPQDRRGAQDQQQPQTPQRPRPALAQRDQNPDLKGDLIA